MNRTAQAQGLASTDVYVQLIHPKPQKRQQKAPETTSQAWRPPSGNEVGSKPAIAGFDPTWSSSRSARTFESRADDFRSGPAGLVEKSPFSPTADETWLSMLERQSVRGGLHKRFQGEMKMKRVHPRRSYTRAEKADAASRHKP